MGCTPINHSGLWYSFDHKRLNDDAQQGNQGSRVAVHSQLGFQDVHAATAGKGALAYSLHVAQPEATRAAVLVHAEMKSAWNLALS